MKTQTRKEFCQTFLKMTLAGLGIPLLFRNAKPAGQDRKVEQNAEVIAEE